jgi:Transposase, Mutator family
VTTMSSRHIPHLRFDLRAGARAPVSGAEGGRDDYRTGHRSKTVITESGPVEIQVPRDRAGSFEPQLVRKRQRRQGGVDETSHVVGGSSRVANDHETGPLVPPARSGRRERR